MQDIIEKIIALPPVTLSANEWQLVIRIVQDLIYKKLSEQPDDILEELQLLNTPCLFTRNQVDKRIPVNAMKSSRKQEFLSYIESWEALTRQLALAKRKIFELWAALFNERMSMDEFIPTLVELYPSDKGTLKKIKHTLSTAMRLALDIGIIEATYLPYFSIAEHKFAQPNRNIENSEQELYDKINVLITALPNADDIIQQFRLKCSEEQTLINQINEITRHCNDYKIYLTETIYQQIKNKYPDLHLEIFKNESTSSEKLDDILLDLFNKNKETQFQLISDEHILKLMKKFIAIYDLLSTCHNDTLRSASILDNFSHKYRLYQQQLEEDSDDLGLKILKTLSGYMIIEQLYLWLPEVIRPRTAVERFNESTKPFAEHTRSFSLSQRMEDGILAKMNPMRIIKR